ncbi:MAG: folylpolyglutamate synthase/dihydrofolate synthase family protein [Thermoleophilia bacterium]
MRFGLERMRALLGALGDPQRCAPALHVVGTNGKSSTTRLAAAALGSRGALVGTYLSPHIVDWTERIQVSGAPIGEAELAAGATAVRRVAEGLDLDPGDGVTQFEALTAIAFHAFAAAGVDAMAIEAGLGGRYDATNVLRPGAAVILTNLALEHTALLGDTVGAIAGEKLAVCADGSRRLVVGPLDAEGRAAVDAELAARDIVAVRYGEDLGAVDRGGLVEVVTPRATYRDLPLGLRGDFQRENLAVALAGAEMVAGGALDEAPLRGAIGAVRIPGRLEVIDGAPPVVLDGAHNPAGMAATTAALPAVLGDRRPVVAVVSVLGDKDAAAMMASLAPVADVVLATRSSHARAVPPDDLMTIARAAGIDARPAAEPHDAVREARALAGPAGAVVVVGSLYLLADVRSRLVPETDGTPAMLARARKGNDPTEANSCTMTTDSA